MRLYHVTSEKSAAKIMLAGFRNGRVGDLGGKGRQAERVSLLDVPAGPNEGARSWDVCIEVVVPDDVAARYELLTEILPGDPFDPPAPAGADAFVAEWSIPAAVLNKFPRRVLSVDEAEDVSVPRRTLFRTFAAGGAL